MNTTRKILVISAIGFAVLTGCGDPNAIPTSPGNPEVYKRISTMTSCAALQKEFNQAMTNAEARAPNTEQRSWSMAYAQYADQRMKDQGCYK